MKRLEQHQVEKTEQTSGEAAIDTQTEVDLISGGVGFDDEPTDRLKMLREARSKQKNTDKPKQ